MNRMKKLFSILIVCTMVLSLAACGGKEPQSATCKIEQNGAQVTMVLDAEGDKVTKITQTSTLALDSFTDEQKELLKESLNQAAEIYKEIEGVKYTSDVTDTEISETITINTDKETLKTVSEKGLLPITGDSDAASLSFSKSKESLKDAGWTIEE